MKGMYFDREGAEIEHDVWLELFQNKDYQILDQVKLDNDYFISTVWLGLDHGFGIDRSIFETIVFLNGDDVEISRYASERGAKLGHRTAVSKYKGKRD